MGQWDKGTKGQKDKGTKGQRNKGTKRDQKGTNKNIHVPKMQHNTTKIFQLINMIHMKYGDKNMAIKIWR